MAFIEKLDGPALNLSPEEFDGYMLHQRAPSSQARKKRLQITGDTQNLLEELQGRQEKLDQGMDALNMQLQEWVQAVNFQLDEATAQFTLVQTEITVQAELSLVSPPPSNDEAHEGLKKEQSVLVLEDKHTGPKDTDC